MLQKHSGQYKGLDLCCDFFVVDFRSISRKTIEEKLLQIFC
jgi:cell fate regulator YaaT (PSP1 superfamily)